MSHKRPYIEKAVMPYGSLRPKIENNATGRKSVAQLSKPWSKSSPRGDEDPVRRACLPSVPSFIIFLNFFLFS